MSADLRAAAERLVALHNRLDSAHLSHDEFADALGEYAVAWDTLRAALAQPEEKPQPEPVAWMVEADGRHFIFRLEKPTTVEGETLTALYAHPADADQIAERYLRALCDLEDAEWWDKVITPCDGEPYQHWRVEMWLPVPLSATDKSVEAALAAAIRARGQSSDKGAHRG